MGGGWVAAVSGYEGSRFVDIKNQVFAESYLTLPRYRIDKARFGKSGDRLDNQVLQAGLRTLTLQDDLIDFPNDQKLFQANGICFAGEWVIDQASAYTGQFSNPTRTLVIVRASVALNGTEQWHKRAFGMAIKLFPRADADTLVPTQNLFVMHSLGGVKVKHVLDLTLDNAPSLGALPPFSQLGTALRLRKDLELADRKVSTSVPDVAFRPVSHLAEDPAVARVVAPTWVRLRAKDSLPRVDHPDFRDELRTGHYPNSQLIWNIDVATGERSKKKWAQWQHIGKLVLSESITSPICDQRLHFAHPTLG